MNSTRSALAYEYEAEETQLLAQAAEDETQVADLIV